MTDNNQHNNDRFEDVFQRLSTVEADLRWIKWLAFSAAASGIFNVFLNAGPLPAIVGGAIAFVASVMVDLIRAAS